MYKGIRYIRIAIALIAMAVPTWALVAGYDSVFVRMQILTALLTGVAVCLIFWAIVTLIYGRIYCSTVCPLGTLIDCNSTAARLCQKSRNSHKGIKGRLRKDYRFHYPAKRVRIFCLLLALCALLTDTALIPTLLDPYSAYARIVETFIMRPLGLAEVPWRMAIASTAAAVFTAAGIVAVAWKRRGRLICNTVCPVGTILGYGSKRSLYHIEIDPDKCINCGECERVCKAECIKLPEKVVDNGRCVVCFDCTAVCPNDAIVYRNGRFRLDMPLMMQAKN